MNTTRYAVMHPMLDCNYGLPLSAKTAAGARRQARKIAAANGLRGYWITYFRADCGERGRVTV